MAHELRLPIVRLVDGTGGGGSVKSLETERRTYVPATRAGSGSSPTWPRCRSWRWPSARSPASARPGWSTSHYSLMVQGTSQLFVAGPPVVARLGEHVTKEELGGSHIHGAQRRGRRRGRSEAEAFARTRRFLSYLPSSVDELPPRGTEPDDDPDRRDELAASGPSRATAARSTRCARSSRPSSTGARGFEIGARLGPLGRHRAGPPRRLAGRGARQRSVPLRRRLDRRRLARR